jgi:heme-degrading monooxygenase HmoA
MSVREPMTARWHIAQINVARFRAAREHPVNADFEAALDEVNALAEASPGFVWRMIGEGDSDDPELTINMTVWESVEALAAFAYRNLTHRAVMRRRAEWFVEMPAYLALWWIEAGRMPTLSEGMAKLELIGRVGPTAEAFDFRTQFPAP